LKEGTPFYSYEFSIALWICLFGKWKQELRSKLHYLTLLDFKSLNLTHIFMIQANKMCCKNLRNCLEVILLELKLHVWCVSKCSKMSSYGFIHRWWTTPKYLHNGTIYLVLKLLLLGGGDLSYKNNIPPLVCI
jgi:hypothetical protein